MLEGLFYLVFALYAVALLVALARPAAGGWLTGFASVLHLGAMAARGVGISFLPLTNKFESFSAAALGLALVATVTWRASRLYVVPLLALALAALGAALTFPSALSYPPPLMRTAWYPMHVPLSFLAYGLREPSLPGLARIDRLALWGFGLWTLSMICGGVWGVLAWGAYFMWDPKILWSVILWFHYASFVHLRRAPSLASRPWVRPALALVGLAWVVVAYVGTSFLFGKSSHAF